MATPNVKQLQEQIAALKAKLGRVIGEDLNIKNIQDGEIDLGDPANDEVEKLQNMSPEQQGDVVDKIEKDINESADIKRMSDAKLVALVKRGETDERGMSPAFGAQIKAARNELARRKKLNEKAGYSAKAAHAGKDIGKPGKNFSKIAHSAAKKYGSKAAGERVAGAILNKLRHEGISYEKKSADTDLMEGLQLALSGQLSEKLKPSMGVGAYIDDFVHSKK
jgi:hypothetical protein